MIKSAFTFKGLDKEAYTKVLALVAMADGVLKEEEVAYYESRMGDILVHPDARKQYRKFLRLHFTIEEVIRNVDKRTLLYALRDSIMMAKIDGVVHDNELQRVMSIAESAGVSKQKMDELSNWVDKGIKWMKKGDKLVLVPLDD